MTHPASHRAAFTLLELAIVIVIIGLIVGGIMAGQSLIRGAELNAVISEYRKYTTAMGQFREKYSALPGDMSNASSYWSTAGIGNGDGNGRITNTAAAGTNEISQFWIHLASSSLIEGSFTAVANTTFTSGTHNPKSKAKGGGWNIAYLGTIAVDGTGTPTTAGNVTGATGPAASTFFANTYEHALLIGSGTSAVLPVGIFEPAEAYNIDLKLDDGKPDTGEVTSLESQGENDNSRCSNQDTNTVALAASSYVLSNTTATACSLVFKTGY